MVSQAALWGSEFLSELVARLFTERDLGHIALLEHRAGKQPAQILGMQAYFRIGPNSLVVVSSSPGTTWETSGRLRRTLGQLCADDGKTWCGIAEVGPQLTIFGRRAPPLVQLRRRSGQRSRPKLGRAGWATLERLTRCMQHACHACPGDAGGSRGRCSVQQVVDPILACVGRGRAIRRGAVPSWRDDLTAKGAAFSSQKMARARPLVSPRELARRSGDRQRWAGRWVGTAIGEGGLERVIQARRRTACISVGRGTPSSGFNPVFRALIPKKPKSSGAKPSLAMQADVLQMRPKSPGKGRGRVKLVQNRTGSDRSRAKFARQPEFVQTWATLGQAWPESTKHGPIRRNRPKFGPIKAGFRSTLA